MPRHPRQNLVFIEIVSVLFRFITTKTLYAIMAWLSTLRPQTRVSQLDAVVLDQEIYDLLLQQVTATFSEFHKSFLTHHKDEIQLALKSLIFKYTLWDNSNTYGYLLQNLSLVDNRSKHAISRATKTLYYLVFILGDYGYHKLTSYVFTLDEDDLQDELSETSGPERTRVLWKLRCVQYLKPLLMNATNCFKVFKLINFLRFLVDGKYNSLRFFILSIGTKVHSLDMEKLNKGNVNYEFQNRQIIWNTLIEFVVFLLPLVMRLKILRAHRKKSLKLFKKDFWQKFRFFSFWSDYFSGKFFNDRYDALKEDNVSTASSPEKSTNDKHKRSAKGKLYWLPESQCAICYENHNPINSGNGLPGTGSNFTGSSTENMITNPYITNCGHIYSYLCVLEKLERHSTGKRLSDLVRIDAEPNEDEEVGSDDSDNDDYGYWRCLRCNRRVLWCLPFDDYNPEAIVVSHDGPAQQGNNQEDHSRDDSLIEESYQNITESQLASKFLDSTVIDQRQHISPHDENKTHHVSTLSDSSSASYASIERNVHTENQYEEDHFNSGSEDDNDELLEENEDYDDADDFDESFEL